MKDSIKYFLEFPTSKNEITVEELIETIVLSFSKNEQEVAKKLLSSELFPKMTRGIEKHPNQQGLLRVVYKKITDPLNNAMPSDRLDALRKVACQAEILDISMSALSLAKANFLLLNSDKLDEATQRGWVEEETLSFINLGSENIKEVSTLLNSRLDKWKKEIKHNHPEMESIYKNECLKIESNLINAQNKTFKTATGSFYNFLNDLNISVQLIEIH